MIVPFQISRCTRQRFRTPSMVVAIGFALFVPTAKGQRTVPDLYRARQVSPFGLEQWRQQRTANFFKRTSPFFGDPAYDPYKTSPLSPFRAPQFHPWGSSPFRGDPYHDPYARRPGSRGFESTRIRPRRTFRRAR